MATTETAAALAVFVTVAGVGGLRAVRARRALYPEPLPTTAMPAQSPRPERRPDHLTAVVLLDHGGAEVSDFLLPYELLASSGAFDVHAVAAERRPAVMTGGLDVAPHLDLAGFAELGLERADLVVIPHLPDPDPRLIDWIRDQAAAGAVILTICSGAAVAAAAGVLDGHSATTFWADLRGVERRFRQVRWVRDVRFVDDGEVVASAGITSGIDATLHVIARLAGDAAQQRAATTVGYDDRTFLDDPSAAVQHRPEPADVILPLTAAFGRRPTSGVLLEDGVDEVALAAVMDTHAASFTARLVTVSNAGDPVVTRHGLTVLPRASSSAAGGVDRLLRPTVPADSRPYDAFQHALTDLARASGRPIARFAAKRLELRSAVLPDDAPAWPALLRLGARSR